MESLPMSENIDWRDEDFQQLAGQSLKDIPKTTFANEHKSTCPDNHDSGPSDAIATSPGPQGTASALLSPSTSSEIHPDLTIRPPEWYLDCSAMVRPEDVPPFHLEQEDIDLMFPAYLLEPIVDPPSQGSEVLPKTPHDSGGVMPEALNTNVLNNEFDSTVLLSELFDTNTSKDLNNHLWSLVDWDGNSWESNEATGESSTAFMGGDESVENIASNIADNPLSSSNAREHSDDLFPSPAISTARDYLTTGGATFEQPHLQSKSDCSTRIHSQPVWKTWSSFPGASTGRDNFNVCRPSTQEHLPSTPSGSQSSLLAQPYPNHTSDLETSTGHIEQGDELPCVASKESSSSPEIRPSSQTGLEKQIKYEVKAKRDFSRLSDLPLGHVPQRVTSRPWIKVNATTKGKNKRPAKIEAFDASQVYDALSQRPEPWDIFEYTASGELETGRTYTTVQIRDYLYNHPLHVFNGMRDRKCSRLRIWIQRAPADSARRRPTAASDCCRWKECPCPANTIQVGHFRVCFDEQGWKKGTERVYHDPYVNAGYLHLYCMERLIDFPVVARDLAVRVDTRTFKRELDGVNRMGLGSVAVAAEAERFLAACIDGQIPSTYPRIQADHHGNVRPYHGTLNHRLHVVKLKTEQPCRHKKRQELGDKGSQIHHHLGDLELQMRERERSRMLITERKPLRAVEGSSMDEPLEDRAGFETLPSKTPSSRKRTRAQAEETGRHGDSDEVEDFDLDAPWKVQSRMKRRKC